MEFGKIANWFGITKLPVLTYQKFSQHDRIPLSLEIKKGLIRSFKNLTSLFYVLLWWSLANTWGKSTECFFLFRYKIACLLLDRDIQLGMIRNQTTAKNGWVRFDLTGACLKEKAERLWKKIQFQAKMTFEKQAGEIFTKQRLLIYVDR